MNVKAGMICLNYEGTEWVAASEVTELRERRASIGWCGAGTFVCLRDGRVLETGYTPAQVADALEGAVIQQVQP
jgi:hypothetical protein